MFLARSWRLDSDSVSELVRSREFAVGAASAEASGVASVFVGAERAATAGESQRIIGLRERYESDFPSFNSSGCLIVDACARALALPAASASLSSSAFLSASLAVVAHARSTPMHGAHNSWSDTVRLHGPMRRRGTKCSVSGSAEDFLPVSEVEAGVNLRLAGVVRRQVAGSLPGRQPGTGTRQVREGAVTEVPDTQFASPGRGLGIRLSMGWTKVCGTSQSGIWVLKGNARTCMFPANLDHLRVELMKRGTYKTAWVTPGHDCLCSYKYGHGAAVRPQTNNAIWHGVIGLWGRVAPLLSPWCGKKDVPTGVNLNQYAGPGSLSLWHSDPGSSSCVG